MIYNNLLPNFYFSVYINFDIHFHIFNSFILIYMYIYKYYIYKYWLLLRLIRDIFTCWKVVFTEVARWIQLFDKWNNHVSTDNKSIFVLLFIRNPCWFPTLQKSRIPHYIALISANEKAWFLQIYNDIYIIYIHFVIHMQYFHKIKSYQT